MSSDWEAYYRKIAHQAHRPATERAVGVLNAMGGVAVDCGCGNGRDSAYLNRCGFETHAFDKEQSAVDLCMHRFKTAERVNVTCSEFHRFDYPNADLVIANASLFFCSSSHFREAWSRILSALKPGGVLCVELLGVKDSWVESPRHDVTAFSKTEVIALVEGLSVIEFSERDEWGKTAVGHEKHWHYFTVIAQKPQRI